MKLLNLNTDYCYCAKHMKAKPPTIFHEIMFPKIIFHKIIKIISERAIFLTKFITHFNSNFIFSFIFSLTCLSIPADQLQGLTFPLPSSGNQVGSIEILKSQKGDTLFSLAQSHDIGVQEIESANPKLELNTPLPLNTNVRLPMAYTLPSVPREGIVLNLAKMRIFYYSPDGKQVSTFPVGIGKQGWSTPIGQTTVVAKEKDPAWHPPASLQREAASRGKYLPLVVPPGPHNPLGKYAMRLGFTSILIHGTNRPTSIGLRSSHGCIRMYPKNIEELFNEVEVNTPVNIISEPK